MILTYPFAVEMKLSGFVLAMIGTIGFVLVRITLQEKHFRDLDEKRYAGYQLNNILMMLNYRASLYLKIV